MVTTLIPHITLMIFGFTTMIVFAARNLITGSRPVNARIKDVHSPIIPHWLMEWTYWVLEMPTELLIKANVSPNTLTIGSMLFSITAAVAFAFGYFATAGWTIIAAGAFDIFDGWVARAQKSGTSSGAFLDSTLDRYSEIAIFLGLMYYYQTEPVLVWLCALGMSGSLMVSYVRARGEGLGLVYKKGFMQRSERMFYLAILSSFAPFSQVLFEKNNEHPLYYPTVFAIVFLGIFTPIGAIQRSIAIYRILKEKKS